MAAVRTLLFYLLFGIGSVVAVLLGFPAAALGRRAIAGVTYGWAGWHRLCARWLLGIRTRIEGTRPAGPVLVAAKHQAMFETIEILLWLDHPVVVMKRELVDIPLWGWVARAYGIIAVDRAGGAAALRRMVAAGRDAKEAGRPIAIFPEGTRVLPGETPPLQPGFAGIYRAIGMPVVPVALDSGRVWPRRSWVKRPGTVTVRFGDPIPPGLPRAEVEARVHAAINALERAS